MSVELLKRPGKAVYQRGVVTCRKCGTPIYVYKLKALPSEFSVYCKQCGDRGIYYNQDIAIQELPERRKKARR